MKIQSTRHLIVIALVFFSAFPLFSFSAFPQGILTPPGPPAPTMKTLQQIEPRIDVLTLSGDSTNQYIIAQSGSYYLSGNILSSGSGNAISVRASFVTIDLNGFTINGIIGSPQKGIEIVGSLTGICIHDGMIINWKNNGIAAISTTGSKFYNLQLLNNSAGTGLQVSDNNIVSHCVITGNTTGLSVGVACNIRDCAVAHNSGSGIATASDCLVTHCVVVANGTNISVGSNCLVAQSTANGSTSGAGILTGNDSAVERCEVTNNASTGISLPNYGKVLDCTVVGNTGDGILSASGARITNNHCEFNGGANLANIHSTLGGNLIESNYASSGGSGASGIRVDTPGGGNVVIKNTAHIYNVASGNDLAPVSSAAAMTSPVGNVSF